MTPFGVKLYPDRQSEVTIKSSYRICKLVAALWVSFMVLLIINTLFSCLMAHDTEYLPKRCASGSCSPEAFDWPDTRKTSTTKNLGWMDFFSPFTNVLFFVGILWALCQFINRGKKFPKVYVKRVVDCSE